MAINMKSFLRGLFQPAPVCGETKATTDIRPEDLSPDWYFLFDERVHLMMDGTPDLSLEHAEALALTYTVKQMKEAGDLPGN